MDTSIEVRALRKRFLAKQNAAGLGGRLRSLLRPEYREVEAVCGVDFTLRRGEMVAFIGPNGAGKSTTIKMLTGILHPSSGEAQVLGLVPWRDRQRLAYEIGTVFGQRSQLWYHLPPLESYELLAHIYDLDDAPFRSRLTALVDQFDIGGLMHTAVRKLSLGERMRCELVGSLLHRPAVLFLDEPTIGLDVVSKQRVRDLVRTMNAEEGTTVFLTSHDAGDVEHLCERAIVINEGRVAFDGSVPSLKQQFVSSRRVELQLVEPAGEVAMPGVRVLQQDGYTLSVEVDISVQPVEAVVSRLLAACRVNYITIEDPPMEEIIAAIYGRAS